MSKKKPVLPVSKPMQKMTGSRPRREERWDSDSFRHCRPKRDWGTAAPADR